MRAGDFDDDKYQEWVEEQIIEGKPYKFPQPLKAVVRPERRLCEECGKVIAHTLPSQPHLPICLDCLGKPKRAAEVKS